MEKIGSSQLVGPSATTGIWGFPVWNSCDIGLTALFSEKWVSAQVVSVRWGGAGIKLQE
jgi:hypothetical protein